MICVAISDSNPVTCFAILEKVEMAEIRLDLTLFNDEVIQNVFSHKTPVIATCRPDKIGFDEQLRRLTLAIQSGANYVDIEIEAPKSLQQEIIKLALQHQCKTIISYHNYKETPGLRELYKIVDDCFDLGADIAKLATLSHSQSDNAKLLALYSSGKPIISLGMGEMGKITRLMAPFMGAEFTFASTDQGESTAPGQIPYSRMIELLQQINLELKK